MRGAGRRILHGMRGLLLVAAMLAGCAPVETKVGEARLIDAQGTVDAPAGPTIEVGKQPIPASLSGPVRLAIDREIPYRDAIAAARAVRAAGGTPIFLVTRRDKVYALPEPSPKVDDAIRLSARADGKACVSPPGTEEATCVSRVDQQRIDRAFVRQILYKAVKTYDLKHVHVVIEPEMPWSDAVRAIDGARTCCGQEAEITVSVEPT
jgi:hypothetical protein